MSSFVRRGFAHVYGDNIPLDEGIMAFKYAMARITDPKELIPHLFEIIDPDFVKRVKPGDFVIAGENFACGKTHMQGFFAMIGLNMAVLCESMTYKPMRRGAGEGLPILAGCKGVTKFVKTGDEIEVDFTTGKVRNITQGTEAQYPAMSPILRDLAQNGGMKGVLVQWLKDHPEQAMEPA